MTKSITLFARDENYEDYLAQLKVQENFYSDVGLLVRLVPAGKVFFGSAGISCRNSDISSIAIDSARELRSQSAISNLGLGLKEVVGDFSVQDGDVLGFFEGKANLVWTGLQKKVLQEIIRCQAFPTYVCTFEAFKILQEGLPDLGVLSFFSEIRPDQVFEFDLADTSQTENMVSSIRMLLNNFGTVVCFVHGQGEIDLGLSVSEGVLVVSQDKSWVVSDKAAQVKEVDLESVFVKSMQSIGITNFFLEFEGGHVKGSGVSIIELLNLLKVKNVPNKSLFELVEGIG